MDQIDFSSVEKFEAIPVGIYPAHIDAVERIHKAGKDFPYYKWTFMIDGGEYDGRKQFCNTSLNPKALFKLLELIEATGGTMPEGSVDFDPESFVGASLNIEVSQGSYEGRITNSVDKFHAF